jgi:hypothetical protein
MVRMASFLRACCCSSCVQVLQQACLCSTRRSCSCKHLLKLLWRVLHLLSSAARKERLFASLPACVICYSVQRQVLSESVTPTCQWLTVVATKSCRFLQLTTPRLNDKAAHRLPVACEACCCQRLQLQQLLAVRAESCAHANNACTKQLQRQLTLLNV